MPQDLSQLSTEELLRLRQQAQGGSTPLPTVNIPAAAPNEQAKNNADLQNIGSQIGSRVVGDVNTQAQTARTNVQTAKDALELQTAQEARAKGTLTNQEMINQIRNQLAAVGDARRVNNSYSTGTIGNVVGRIPLLGNTDRSALETYLGTISAASRLNMIQALKEQGAALGASGTGLGATSIPEFASLGEVNFNLEDAMKAGPDVLAGELNKAEEVLLRRLAAASVDPAALANASPEERRKMLADSYAGIVKDYRGQGGAGGGGAAPQGAIDIAKGDTRVVQDPAFSGLNSTVAQMVRNGAKAEDIVSVIRERRPDVTPDLLAQVQKAVEYYRPYVGKALPPLVGAPPVDLESRTENVSLGARAAGVLADNPVGAAVIGTANGVTLGGLDELIGATSGMTTAEADALKRYFADNYGTSYTLGNIAGGVAGAIPMVRGVGAGAAALGLGAKGVRAAQAGANILGGAVSGGLEANQDRGTGALLGGALAGGGDLLGTYLGGKLAPRLFDAPGGAENAIAGAVVDPNSARGILAQADTVGSPLSMADADPGLRSLAGSATRNSTSALTLAERNIGGRDAEAFRRGVLAVDQNLASETNVVKAAKQIRSDASAAADTYYKAALPQKVPTGDKVLEDALSTPTAREGIAYARRIAGDEQRKLGISVSNGRVTIGKNATFQDLDYVKRGMDDYIRENFTNDAGQFTLSDTSRKAVQARDAVVARMRELNSDYGQALDTVSGPYAAAQQLEFGGKAVFSTKANAKQIGEAVASLSPEELKNYRVGAANAIIDRLKKPDAAADTWKMLRGPDMQERLRAIFPDAGVDKVNSISDMESLMRSTRNELLSGSASAARLGADAAFGAQAGTGILANAAEGVAAVATGGISSALTSLVRAGTLGFKNANKLQQVANQQKLAEDLAPILLETDPKKAKAALDAILKKVETYNAKSGRLRTDVGAGAAAATRPILQMGN